MACLEPGKEAVIVPCEEREGGKKGGKVKRRPNFILKNY